MNNKKEIPGIILLASWLLSLIVFVVGFWHTYLGLKEMKPFNSEYGALAVAAIVLLLLLITYWFAVNGHKMALIFYIACGLIFFVCNLNYFYPSYTARPLIQNEAKALNDTLQKYTNGSSVIKSDDNSKAVSDYLNLLSLQDQIVTEISNLGYGPNAKNLTNQFNSISSAYSVQPISIGPAVGFVTNDPDLAKKQREDIEPLFNDAVGSLLLKGILKVADPNLFRQGQKDLAELNKQYTDTLNAIAADNDAVYNLDSIKQNKNVRHIVEFVGKLNTTIDKLNKGNKKSAVLKELDEDEYPRADKLGTIKHTITSIGERLNEIDTWAIIFLCLFIDLLVPLAIYLLLRKKGDEPTKSFAGGPIKY
jgi:hypothetical protein